MKFLAFVFILLTASAASAQELIVRPYQSARAAGMGNVRYTTGLYDENFFANPARVTANPARRLRLLDFTVEVSAPLPEQSVRSLMVAPTFTATSEVTPGPTVTPALRHPALYIPPGDGKWAYAFAIATSTQADVNLRRSFNIDPLVITDVGPVVSVGRKLLEDDALSVGVNTHLMYRLSTTQGFTFIDLIQGRSFSPTKTGGQGTGLDFDTGATYELKHFSPGGFHFSAAFAIDNLFDGHFSNIGFKPVKGSDGNPSPANLPNQQPRIYNVGVAATRPTWWHFHDTSFAIETTDIGNNPNGSLFRTIHAGGETPFGILAGRVGINQGYWCLGAGVGLRFIEIDAATYGEELSLNPGGLEDRRYALHVALQI